MVEKSISLTQFVSSSRHDLLYSVVLPLVIFLGFPFPANFEVFLSSLHVFQAVFSRANKVCFICKYECYKTCNFFFFNALSP